MSLRKSSKRLPAKVITINEIAEEAGVSTATVSRVFNQPNKVKKTTREAVLAAAERHHYVTHGLAGGLASRRSRLLGLVIPTVSNSIYGASTQAVQQAAQRAGYTVLVGVSDFSEEREAELIHQLVSRRVEGLILTGERRSQAVYDKIIRNQCPFVITWKLTHSQERPSVSFDNAKATRAAVNHLLSLRHRRIGLICGHTDLNDRALQRRVAFEKTLRDAGIEPDPELMFESGFEYVEGRAAMHRMLRLNVPPTAVFCANDIQAIGALSECRETGLSVPDDMSIVGFDDLPIAQYITPKLTTVRVPAEEMGDHAARRLIAAIETGETVLPLALSTDLIIRETTAQSPRRQTPRRNPAMPRQYGKTPVRSST
jgi:LacI family transcriptional regulator, galactose operon repressor